MLLQAVLGHSLGSSAAQASITCPEFPGSTRDDCTLSPLPMTREENGVASLSAAREKRDSGRKHPVVMQRGLGSSRI